MAENEQQDIIKGEKITLKLLVVKEDGRPEPLTGVDEMVFCIVGDDGASIEKKLSLAEIVITDDILGEYEVYLLRENTLLFQDKENQTFCVRVVNSTAGTDRIIKYERLLNVTSCPCS